MVNNFPLSHVIFKVNFPLSNDPLALVSAKRQQQRHNTGLSLKLKLTRLSSFIEFISHILLQVFHSSRLFNAQIFHSDTQAKLQFWDTGSADWLPFACWLPPTSDRQREHLSLDRATAEVPPTPYTTCSVVHFRCSPQWYMPVRYWM